nr:ATP dependent RNA helicase DDX24 [Hymenolepis microstoma]
MTKKKRKINFTQTIDIGFSSISRKDQNDEQVKDILSKERLAALNQMKRQLPNAPESERLQEIIGKIPDSGPFILIIRNLDFTAGKTDVGGFLHPLKPIRIEINNQSKLLKGRCLVFLSSKQDLTRAFEKNHKFLLNREVHMSIANEAEVAEFHKILNSKSSGNENYNHCSFGILTHDESKGWTRKKTNLSEMKPPDSGITSKGWYLCVNSKPYTANNNHTGNVTSEMWNSLNIPENILKAISELKFDEPTPIQQQVLPLAVRDHSDILGSAPTGSGKTLAFGIPLIMRVLEAKAKSEREKQDEVSNFDEHALKIEKKRKIMDELAFIEELDPDTMNVVKIHDLSKKSVIAPSFSDPKVSQDVPDSCVRGLVILPTRELAIQVTSHLRALVTHITSPSIAIESIVGGISLQKQDRILKQRKPDIVVATPGRLWEFILGEHEHLVSMPRTLVGVVFDEADRLVESQHFVELGSILKFLRDKRSEDVKRQTFVFSATLTFVHNNAMLPGSNSKKLMKKLLKGKKMDINSKLGFLREMLGLSAKAKVVDLSSSESPENPEKSSGEDQNQPEEATRTGILLPSGLSEYRLICQNQVDKDALLVWLLLAARLTNPGRALIFVNSKSGARRLSGVLRQCSEISSNLSLLHADMLQKQRLRSLERFQASEKAVVLATDVAARGLDFASCPVSWVIHFDVPRTAETYIHRCGRTARANRPGRSVVMIAPGDIVHWRKLAKNLRHLPMDKGVPDLLDLQPIPTTEDLNHFRSITHLMREMDEIQHSASKKDADRDWLVRTAREADLDIDSDLGISSDDDEGGPKRKPAKQIAAKSLTSLKHELASLLHSWKEGTSRKRKKHQKLFHGSRKCFKSRDFPV